MENRPKREFEIAAPQLPFEEIVRPQVEMEDIYAVQALVMGYIRLRARTKRSDYDDKKYRMAMLERETDDLDTMYDGSRDKSMSCKVQKKRPDQWRMLVSFVETLNTEQTDASNVRRTYRFDWLRNGNRQAWYEEKRRSYRGSGQDIEVLDTHPITSPECLELQDEMLQVSESVNPISSDSIFMPRIR